MIFKIICWTGVVLLVLAALSPLAAKEEKSDVVIMTGWIVAADEYSFAIETLGGIFVIVEGLDRVNMKICRLSLLDAMKRGVPVQIVIIALPRPAITYFKPLKRKPILE